MKGRIPKSHRTMAWIVILITFVFLSGPAWSWGRLGHVVTARMAQARLTPAALASVQELLGPGVTLADIATWADQQREVAGSAPWHYVDVPLSEPRYDAKCNPKDHWTGT